MDDVFTGTRRGRRARLHRPADRRRAGHPGHRRHRGRRQPRHRQGRQRTARSPFVEPDLAIAVSGAVAMGRLTATTEMPEADAFIIAVPTPFQADHTADLSYIRAAVEAIAPAAARRRGGRSSSRPRRPARRAAGQRVAGRAAPGPARCRTPGTGLPDVFVAHCPERVLPGRVMIEIVTNDRVIGGVTTALRRQGRDALPGVLPGRSCCCSPTPPAPRWPSWSRTPTATSTSPSPTSCR